MTDNVKALLVFCEGPHDVAFVRMVLRKLMEFEKLEQTFNKLPSPFHKLFEQSIKNHVALDLSLDMAHKFFLPDSLLRKEDHLILLFNCGGKYQFDKIKILLADYLQLFPIAREHAEGATEVVSTFHYLFLFDADAEGLAGALQNVRRNLSNIDEFDFLTEDWLESPITKFGKTAGDKAVFVWGESPDQGTLEDIILPMFELGDNTRTREAKTAINALFSWGTANEDIRKAIPEIEKNKKAIITLVGQREKPGASMNVILEQAGLIPQDVLKNDLTTLQFTVFIKQFIGLC